MTPDLLTAAEVAAIVRVDPVTVYRWAANGTLDSIRIGSTVRFRQSDVDALLERDGAA